MNSEGACFKMLKELCVLLLGFTSLSALLEIPEPFSASHHRISLPGDAPLHAGLFSSFQLDTHIDVVLVSDEEMSEADSYLLSSSLDHLSALSIEGARTNRTHEKVSSKRYLPVVYLFQCRPLTFKLPFPTSTYIM